MSRKPAPPAWIGEFKRRTAIIDIIALAYTHNCDCEVCQRLREVGEELGNLFMPSGPETVRIGTRKGFR